MFFADCPWFGIPAHRKAEILVEPLYPSGLLGGSSTDGKMSKLAALAAKRRRKENENLNPPSAGGPEAQIRKSPSSGLQSLRSSRRQQPELSNKPLSTSSVEHQPLRASTNLAAKDSTATEDLDSSQAAPRTADSGPSDTLDTISSATASRAIPSPFGATITARQSFSLDIDQNIESHFTSALTLNDTPTKPFDFTDPSPDDVVTIAQTTKGLSRA